VLTYVGTQTNFWIIANILLASIITLQSKAISHIFGISVEGKPGPIFLIAVVMGILCGVALGLIDYYLEKNVFRNLSMGKVILLKALRSLAILILLLLATRFALIDLLLWQSIYPSSYCV
jgi:adenylate cyclase